MTRTPAIETHKEAIRQKYNSGIGVHPFSVLYNHTYAVWQASPDAKRVFPLGLWDETDVSDGMLANEILFTANLLGRPTPGLPDLLAVFERRYAAYPNKARRALKVILECPVEEGYEEWKENQKKLQQAIADFKWCKRLK